MELPAALKAGLDQLFDGVPLNDIQRGAARLSQRYRAEIRDGQLHLNEELAVKAYLAARLPATYAAVRTSFEAVAEALPGFVPETLLDVGAGPGTALWAAKDCWPSITQGQLVETSESARKVGSVLAEQLSGIAPEWIAANAEANLGGLKPADLVTMAYVLDELSPASIGPLVSRLWALAATLVIVEPGTPAGWRRILAARAQLIGLGATIVAPCPHASPCPLAAPDWCHFARRVARSKLHRLAKGGDAPFEDEKYIFIAASRLPATASASRVLAPPRHGKAWIDLKLCQPNGEAAQAVVSKRDAERYRIARRLDWGDAFGMDEGGSDTSPPPATSSRPPRSGGR